MQITIWWFKKIIERLSAQKLDVETFNLMKLSELKVRK
jgi:hypothetical protein